MPKYEPQVNAANLYIGITTNTIDALEILREAISNSIDARATKITIELVANNGKFDLKIIDNGTGMDEDRLKAYFDMARSVKDSGASIGHKGLGSKTAFCSDSIKIQTVRNKAHLVATMQDPWETLKRHEMPSAEIEDAEEHDKVPGGEGTVIDLRGVTIPSLQRNNLSAEDILGRVKDYISWQTAAGTFKTEFAHLEYLDGKVVNIDRPPDIELYVRDAHRVEKREAFKGVHKFPQDNPNPAEGPMERGVQRRSNNFVKFFKHEKHTTMTLGETEVLVSWQCTGVVAGYDARSKLAVLGQGERHKKRFGLRLCKDFIPIIKRDDILETEYFYDTHILLNSQNFILNADRNQISNLESQEAQWVTESFKDWFKSQVEETYLNELHRMRSGEKERADALEKTEQMKRLKAAYSGEQALGIDAVKSIACQPINEAGTIGLLSAMLECAEFADHLKPIAKIGQYIDKATDLIALDHDESPILVEVEFKLKNLFSHGHPIESYDAVVCWDLGTVESGDTFSSTFSNGEQLAVQLKHDPTNGAWGLHWGSEHRPVIVLKHILDSARSDSANNTGQ